MRGFLSGLLGVPATILIAAGLGIMAVTVISRVMPKRTVIRWAHLVLGVAMLGIGVALLGVDVNLLGTG
ncbi:MAG: hypothetical protein ACR2GX_06830 [Candidatus Dormibacteria bacterium]